MRIFISSASREFGRVRDALANALRARGVMAVVQTAFRLNDGTTLAKLHDYIRDCDRVLAVVGDYSGAYPPPGAVTPELRAMLPEGWDNASYTQWEVIIARHYHVPTYFFESAGFAAEQSANPDDQPEAQARWRDFLFDGGWGMDRRQFHSADRLEAECGEPADECGRCVLLASADPAAAPRAAPVRADQRSGPFAAQSALYNEYAALLQALARFSEAEPLKRQALGIAEASYGPDHPVVATEPVILNYAWRDPQIRSDLCACFGHQCGRGIVGLCHPQLGLRTASQRTPIPPHPHPCPARVGEDAFIAP